MLNAALTLVMMTVLQAGSVEHPFTGRWTANFSKSRLHASFQPKTLTLHITVAANSITMASEMVDAKGHTQRAAETFRTDGTETPGTLSPGVTLMAQWLGTKVLASAAWKGDQLIALVTYEVSSDGQTLTSRSSGSIEQVVVFDRNAS